MGGVNDQRLVRAGAVVGDRQRDEAPLRDRRRDEFLGHAAPAQPGQKKVEAPAEIDEPPRLRADDAVFARG